MQISVSKPNRNFDTLCEYEIAAISDVQASLEKISLPNNAKEATTSLLRGQLDQSFSDAGWISGLLIDSDVSLEYPTANYTLDLFFDGEQFECAHRHRFFVEFCFDNRQAIGTNLLKFQVASANARLHGFTPLGFLICADAASVKHYGWDGGVASYQEYDHAIRIPYKPLISDPPVLLSLRS